MSAQVALSKSEETKQERTVEIIRQEYQNLCTKVGHTQYQIFTLTKDVEAMNSAMRDLNIEAATLQAKQTEEAKKEETSNA